MKFYIIVNIDGVWQFVESCTGALSSLGRLAYLRTVMPNALLCTPALYEVINF